MACLGGRGHPKDEADRPGVEASMELIRRKAVEILYVAKLDRLSRRGLEHVGTLLDEIDGSVDASSSSPTGWTHGSRPFARPSPCSPSRLAPRPMPQPGGYPNGMPTTDAMASGSGFGHSVTS
jgi:Resolvase, N terminal domain